MSQQSSQPPQPTKSLKQFDVLIGEWDMVGTHPMIPSPVKGHSTFEWLRDGGLLVWHFNWEQGPGIPNAYSLIGHDDAVEECFTLYTDDRGVSRIYQMTLEGGIWKMWRDTADFSQRMTGTFSNDGNTITVQGEMSHDGSTWEQDLNVTYTRKK
ncbi:MAG: hypothetical protein UZ15_CFX003000844 [Chloroflexi bacterium OLB15]|nr:MAG: hypothetical protein UZ15_CFX003000844 [Chloroflexi bacterium OLB15]